MLFRSFSRISSRFTARTNSSLSRLTIAGGVLAGAKMPTHDAASKPATVDATVGRPGNSADGSLTETPPQCISAALIVEDEIETPMAPLTGQPMAFLFDRAFPRIRETHHFIRGSPRVPGAHRAPEGSEAHKRHVFLAQLISGKTAEIHIAFLEHARGAVVTDMRIMGPDHRPGTRAVMLEKHLQGF